MRTLLVRVTIRPLPSIATARSIAEAPEYGWYVQSDARKDSQAKYHSKARSLDATAAHRFVRS